eukprot:TRINITY_DN17755_c0_g1_i1.p1 TRINITY_DN17755_c0_g1~~TRINITY_DN17755_c0_g1_i1.p1  ORF type:complete len:426 (-),score=77.50 TRINITY_DN17755_c0_g1_i1:305-1531(-)
MHAAAARAGAARSSLSRAAAGGSGSSRDFREKVRAASRAYRLEQTVPSDGMGKCASKTVCFLSLGFLIAAIVLLASSLRDTRGAAVRDFDEAVRLWATSGRADFGGALFNVTARLPGSVESMKMIPVASESEDIDWRQKDSEAGLGVDIFQGLAFVARLPVPGYHEGNATARAEMAPLPPRSEAPMLTIDIVGGNGGKFSLGPLPIHFDEVLKQMTPNPEGKCWRVQRGHWRQRQCHVVRRLANICIQVERTASGAWQAKQQPESPEERQRGVRAGPGVAAPRVGCDPQTAWDPTVYDTDACWGPPLPSYARQGECEGTADRPHFVDISLRSELDPFIRAEVLTEDRFDFGLAVSSQRGIAGALLFVSLVLALPTLLRLKRCQKRCSRSDEELSALSPGATKVGCSRA